MNILSIKETCIYVKDLERTKDFYSNKLGLSLISLVKNRHVFFRAGNSVLLCFIAKQTQKETELPPHGATGTIHFAFEISKEEYSTALHQIKNSGIEILHEHLWKKGLRSFYFYDPDNNLVEIIEQGLWEE
jgi:catechol 2,3-dioxygenase-like lactoylglutathione lyase family enzyme